ncbi:hypothetical protein WH47_04059 [Habropoda laboriosa]|uniref:Uncharacterized protein n=1 Tax=Habropoda laboriosa TaxID=597456 RepID=A0A0L7QV05_9HYME|nr:hypothetical protein WH47_04059 [Habropoda laboriosa]
MNNIRIITLKLLRTYGTKTMSENAGVRRKREVTKYSKDFETDFEELDHDDIGIYESDFTEVAKFYEEKKRARKADHEQLKRLIVKSKYFKEVEPSFLTYVEKEQIKKLHKTNPDEWTPQKLSESFPALPETIKKILKASWVPKSVDTILKYDKKVIQNWKNWKTGQLAVNFNLKEHLMKFKNRTISLTDRETLVNKFVAPKMEFPKPTSSFFSSIVQSVDKKQVINNEQLKSSEKSLNKECKNLEDVSFNVLNSTAKYTNVQEKDIGIVKNLSSESSTIVKKNRIESKVATEMNAEHVSLDTFVKDRSSYMDTDVNYIKRLKIPKNSYKKGMTYRVNDCYYDDDGEFLYRIPGMRS